MVYYMDQLNLKKLLILFEKTKAEVSPSQIILKDDLNKIGFLKQR